ALQEVDRFNGRTGGIDLASLIARELSMNLIYGIEFFELNRRRRSGGGDCGNAILTRLPTERPRIVPLPVAFDWTKSRAQPRLGRRMALALDLHWGPHRLRVINAHLENQCFRRQRMLQTEALLEAERSSIARGPALLMGDMNTFFFREPKMLITRAAEHGFVDALPPRPRGTWGRIFKLDYILARGLTTIASGVGRDVKSSDHKPLWATFERPDDGTDPDC
ncbi:MAG: endonuclease/exonuclease/phosphatase family protein, partial [Candidatus Riflebacteria bacterium]|nr:endonuclease/exonuclease/phosphatase family protein [Candidatus Riflebacteria bacterium]